MDKQTDQKDDEGKQRPNPEDFVNYIPWACGQLQINAEILVTKIIQSEYAVNFTATDRSKIRKGSKAKMQSSKTDIDGHEKDGKSSPTLRDRSAADKTVNIYAIYDNCDNLVHLKFDNDRQIPPVIMKLLGLIIKFHPQLYRITINRGCSALIVYEMHKFLKYSNITDICLDDTFISEANYHILLENKNNIRQISLARCKLDDAVVKNIASKLPYPSPASKTLSILNLSSNRISDDACQYLGDALRSNRQLRYLNLADNSITDTGAEAILNGLQKFPLTNDEIVIGRRRYMIYLKEKDELINRMITELKSTEIDRRTIKRKERVRSASVAPQKKNKIDKESSLKALNRDRSTVNLDAVLYEKAVAIAENVLDDYHDSDPFSFINTIREDGTVYCLGNNTLCYLNLAYNSISYITLKKLLNVVLSQKILNRRTRGLINICIEGNQIPSNCLELKLLDEYLEYGLSTYCKSVSALGKKRPGSKSGK